MNEIVNKFLFAGDKFMPEMNLRQPGLASVVYKLFDKKSASSGVKSIPNKQVADGLQYFN